MENCGKQKFKKMRTEIMEPSYSNYLKLQKYVVLMGQVGGREGGKEGNREGGIERGRYGVLPLEMQVLMRSFQPVSMLVKVEVLLDILTAFPPHMRAMYRVTSPHQPCHIILLIAMPLRSF